MDRLAAYFHWNDLQCFEQAIWIAEKQSVKINQVKEWAKREGEEDKFNNFLNHLETNRLV
jgi:uncharacterized protein YjcR